MDGGSFIMGIVIGAVAGWYIANRMAVKSLQNARPGDYLNPLYGGKSQRLLVA